MLERADEDTWTGKDHLAHLAAWQRIALARVTGVFPDDVVDVERNGTSEDTIDAENAVLHERYLHRSLDDVRLEFGSSYDQLCRAVESMNDDVLGRKWKPGDPRRGTFAQMIAGNTFEHYVDHIGAFHTLAER
jgi:hypothetical protein